MYIIEKTYFGFHITFEGQMSEAEAAQFKAEVENIVPSLKQPFSTIIDLRTWIPAEPRVLTLLQQAEQLSKNHGLQRRAIIVHSPVIKGQAVQLSFTSETNELERCINASNVEDWEKQAIAWAVHGVEPTPVSSVVSSPD